MNKKIKIVLLENIKNIGKKGEIKEVNSGFAQNFLIPNKKASYLDKETIEKIKSVEQKEIKKLINKSNDEITTFKEINQKELSFELKEKKGRSFGSITYIDILKKLKDIGIENINKNNFTEFKPLHEIGEHIVKLKINKDLIAELKINIRAKQA